jgi:hypothetical protein
MAIEQTPKFGLTIWTADTDEFSRIQMTESHNQIDDFAVLVTSNNGPPPPVTSTLYNSLYFDEAARILYYCDGVADAWRQITLDPTIKEEILTGAGTTKGDIIARGASSVSRHPIGTNGQFLTANSTTTTGLQWIDGVTPTASQTLTNKTLTSPTIDTATLNRAVVVSPMETWSVSTSPISTTAATAVPVNILTANSSSFLYTGEATNTWIPNVRGSSTTTLNSILGVGQSMTVSVAAKINNAAAFASSLLIDGSANTILWQGGLTPNSGNVGATDVYTYAIVKTASATFTVFASRTRFG